MQKKASGVASGPKQGERVGLRSNLILWKPGWRSGESTCLPPMFCGFKSRHLRHMWAEFVVCSFLCSERFFSGFFSFPLPYMLPNLNFILNALTFAKQFLHVIVLGPISQNFYLSVIYKCAHCFSVQKQELHMQYYSYIKLTPVPSPLAKEYIIVFLFYPSQG